MEFAIFQAKMVRLPRNKKQTYRLKSRPQTWPSGMTLAMTLTLNFQGQIWNLLHLSQKWSDCHETKSKYINWILGLRCDHQIWPWPWPSPWIFKVRYGNCYMSTKNGPIATKRKAAISIALQASNVCVVIGQCVWPLNFQGEVWPWPHTWLWPWIFMGKFWISCISKWEAVFYLTTRPRRVKSCFGRVKNFLII